MAPFNYKENYIIQGFNILNDKKSSALCDRLDLYSDTFCEDVSREEYEKEVERLIEGELDKKSQGTSRKEQSYLRKILFKGRKTAKCGICGNEFPVELLVTAHIKKRAECSKPERLDVNNIVTPMCKLGCDDLYEKGYILIRDGIIMKNYKKLMCPIVHDYLDKMDNTLCISYNNDNEKYFDYHNNKFE